MAPQVTWDSEDNMEKKLTAKQILEEKAALLTVLLDQLSAAEATLDKLQELEVNGQSSPTHDTLGISDLVADAYEMTEALREETDRAAESV